jgi:quercetin dioxygenase-like cupin family protein
VGTAGRIVRAEADVFKATGADTDGRFEMLVMDVEYGFGPPAHIHEVQDDSFYVLDGTLTVLLGDDLVELAPGDFATAPPGVVHTFTNTDPDRAARMVNLMTPGIGFDTVIKAAMATADPAELERVGKEYGLTVVGPPLAVRLGLDVRSD